MHMDGRSEKSLSCTPGADEPRGETGGTGMAAAKGERFWDTLERVTSEERFARAQKIRAKMGIYGAGGQTQQDFYKISKPHTQGLMEWCFGTIWADDTLEPKIKEVAVLAAMVAQDLHNEVEWHVKSGLNLGLTREEIIALIVQCTPYCGYPKVNHALNAAMRAFRSIDEADGAGKGKKGKKGKK
jgi:4-carboxymuconolactone decarboxylase